jgi:Clostripain family
MKLNGQKGHQPPKSLKLKDFGDAGKSKSETSLVTPFDGADFDPMKSSFQLLAQHGRMAATYESGRIATNLSNGYEALVQFKDGEDKSYVLAVRKEADIPLYAALVSGTEVEPSLDKLHKELKTAHADNNKFYLKRDNEYLPTDAAAASLALQRGSRVVLRRSDGQYETHKSADAALSFLAQSDKQAAAAQRDMEAAKLAGLSLSALPAQEDAEPPSRLSMIAQMFNRSSDLEIDKTLAEALTKDGRLQVSFEEDERPLALPLVLNREEINLAAKWGAGPNREIKNFKKQFKALTEGKSIFMTQQAEGDMKGMVVRADDRAAYFQLRHGERVVVLDKDGDLHEMKSLNDFATYKNTGHVSPPDSEPFDGSKTDSDNLMMFYHVSPFDPLTKGNYDDLPQRLTAVGSSERLDIVTMRSDLPTKRNLRVERVQDGQLQELKRLDAETAMNNPKVLEDFVYETVKSNMGDDKIRFLVGGHGGAEKGLLPDGENNNSAANDAMPVDEFAGAISKALERVEKETGERPKIDNLMMVSCLMGNTSFIHALAKTGYIETLVASPELMAGSNPLSTFEYLNDPKTSKASGREYAQYLVNEWSEAPAMIGGSKEHHHADTIGAYDLSPVKAERFQKALGGFFEAALAEPKYAEYFKEGIARAPSYGINPIINVMFDVDDRDLLQVLDSTSQDARIKSPKLKQAMAELMEATEDQVIHQKVSENYQGRRGPSLYLPLDKWDFNEKMADTELLKSVKYKEFMEMIFEAPLQRSVVANLINEASRLSETGVLDGAIKKFMDAASGKTEKMPEPQETKDARSPEAENSTDPKGTTGNSKFDGILQNIAKTIETASGPEAKELQAIQSLEEILAPSRAKKVMGLLKGTIRTAMGLAVGAATGIVAAVPAAALGSLTGAVAGWRGTSASGTHKPASKEEMEVLTKVVDQLLEANDLKAAEKPAESAGPDTQKSASADKSDEARPKEAASEDDVVQETEPSPDLSPLKHLVKGRVAKGLKQLVLWPSEGFAIKTHEAMGRKYGELPGRIIGAVTGAVTGAVLNALAVGGVAFVGAGLFTAHRVDQKLSRLQPADPAKGDAFFTGRFEPPAGSNHQRISHSSEGDNVGGPIYERSTGKFRELGTQLLGES